MDSIDYEILKHLQLNAKLPMKELASYVHLSVPAVAERVKKL
jgi:Lrp/AsnC family transcriptional regulator, leucine-responsive regulatory protein